MDNTSFSPRIRIEKIELKNFKGVKNGVVEFNCLKTLSDKETCSDILGIYGQNGSGKTTLLEALHVAILAMKGRKIPFEKYGNIINQDSDVARVTISFQVSNPDGTCYHLEYAFSLGTWEYSATTEKNNKNKGKNMTLVAGGVIISSAIPAALLASSVVSTIVSPIALIPGAISIVASQIMKSASSGKEVPQIGGIGKHLAVFDEVLSLSGVFNGTMVRMAPIFDTRTTEAVFLPKTRHKSFFPNNTASALKVLQNQKKRALVRSKSFIFSDELSQLLLEQEQISEYAQIIMSLKAFAVQYIRVIDSKLIESSGNDSIILYTATRGVGINRSDSTTTLDDEGLRTLRTAIKGLNVIVQQVIPGLSLKAVRQVDEDLDECNSRTHNPSTKVKVYSVRDKVRIPLAEESAGIIRIISTMGLFAYAFAYQNVTVAIDEIDAGVYEYLLGDLLWLFEEYGSGQLIFTCHNLRPMEVLDKKNIYFTTTNPENRYLKPKNIRNENNLRDVYLREIVMGGQEEDLYVQTKHEKIAFALKKAGEIIGQD